MYMQNEPYNTLNQRWASVCKVLLKQEIGDMQDYILWLKKDLAPIFSVPSSISGKSVAFSTDNYCNGSKRCSLSEQPQIPKFEPLDINQIKDIDSILGAISENIYYTGDIVLGNCSYVLGSTNINDSFYILDSAWIGESKYMAYCTRARHSEDCFGTYMAGESSTCIKDHGSFRNKRNFECWQCRNSSDCYYSHSLDGCTNSIFSFNLISKHYYIGNLALEKSKYNSIKSNLVSQITEELNKNKKIPSLMEIAAKSKITKPVLDVEDKEDMGDPQKIVASVNEDFSKTFKLILKKGSSFPLDDYSKWLTSKFPNVKQSISIASAKPIRVIQFANVEKLPLDRLLSVAEAKYAAEKYHLSNEEVESLDFNNIHNSIGKIAFFCSDWKEGRNSNLFLASNTFSCSNLYNVHCGLVRTKDSAFDYWARDCSNIFGSSTLFSCNFCIQCHHSIKLARCFECDSCEDCSDCYYCHNLENSTECMFCFNAKSLRYAIANKEYPKEEYLKIKKLILDELNSKLENSKKLELSIFNLGCKK